MKQECIPVGCVCGGGRCIPAYTGQEGVCPGGCLPRRVSVQGCLPRGVSAGGCLSRGRCLPRGVSAQGCMCVSQNAMGQTPPSPHGQTDACENITFATFELIRCLHCGHKFTGNKLMLVYV